MWTRSSSPAELPARQAPDDTVAHASGRPLDFEQVLVTGAGGFMGRQFRAAFNGFPLRDADGSVDLRARDRVTAAIEARVPAAVVHLGAQSSVPASFADARTTYEINFLGTLNLLEALRAAHFAGVLLLVSSADVYGTVEEQNLPIREHLPMQPRSPYAVSKVAAEALCFEWARHEHFRIVVVRPFNQIGPGQDTKFAIPGFARQIVEMRRGQREPLLHTGDLDVTRDFTDVADGVRALAALLEHGRHGEVYNLCSGRERTVRSLVDALLAAAGVAASIQVDPDRLRPNEQRRVAGDNSKLREHTGWSPQVAFDTTILNIYREMETRLDG